MGIATTYKEYLLEKFLLEHLKNNEIPTSDELQEELEEYQAIYPDLTKPISKYENFSVEHGEESSAAKMLEVAETFSQDIGIVTRELYRIALESSKRYERWTYEMKRLDARARKIEQRVDSLLLLANNTAGYFATVGDVFSDLSLVDTSSTNALVNINEGIVSLNPGTSSLEGVKQINTSGLGVLDVTFSPLSSKPGTVYFPVSTGNELINIFKTSLTTWVGKISSLGSGQMIAELKANISKDKDSEVSRVILDWMSPCTSNKAYISLMYSVDGYTWYSVPTNDVTKTITPVISWNFPLTKMRWIKLIITKPSPDEGKTYLYSIRNVRLYGNVYSEDLGSTFVSKSLSSLNSNNQEMSFSLAQLETCETIPDNTTIDFYVSASKDNSTWTDWANILPSQREGVSYPRVVNFAGSSEISNKNEEDVDLYNSSITSDQPQMRLSTTFDDTENGYRFKTNDFAVVNTVIPIPAQADSDTVAGSITLWRNTKSSLLASDTELVRGISRGWGLDGQTYSCYFEVISSGGKLIDFGESSCVIDGQLVSGAVTISKGIHRFSTSSDNWKDISGTLSEYTSYILNEETLSSIDPLYPYNHKLLIEGFPYVSSFIGEKKYTGTDISGEFYSTKTNLFDLENNNRDYSYYALRGISDDSIAVIVRYNSNNSDYSNELFLVKWKNSSEELYKYIKIKAELGSSNDSLTPSFTSYRIKLGI